MKQMLAVLCGFCLLLTGCASTRSLSPPTDAGSKTWVVVSTLGNKAKFQHIGTTVFNNAGVEVDTTNWALDKYLESDFEKQAPGLKWVHVDVPQALRNGLSTVGDKAMITSMMNVGTRSQSLKDLRTLCACDLAVIISPLRWQDTLTGTNALLYGYGVHQRGLLFKDNTAWAFISCVVTLVDLRSGEETGSVGIVKSDRLSFLLDKDRNLVISPEQMKQLEDSIKALADAGLVNSARTLPKRQELAGQNN